MDGANDKKEMSDAEMWREHKKQMENMRRKRRDQIHSLISKFRSLGFEVKKISQYQYRFNGLVDIFPSNKRYFNLQTKERGDIRGKSFEAFLREFFGLD